MRAVSAIASAITEQDELYWLPVGADLNIPYRNLEKLKGCTIRKMIKEYELTTDKEIDDALKNKIPLKIKLSQKFLTAYDNMGT